jgi:hypothetical protein
MDEEKEVENASNCRQILARFNLLGRHSKPSIPENRQPNPEYHAGFFSLLTFSWMSPILAVSSALSRFVQEDEENINLAFSDRLSTPAGGQ